ncbi:hypothetical protein [Prevotella nigrescens]|jgi:hypothetical protein|uniref:hypothetical protein n=1 Tax=Prevotella nigrescens TaxID=28133 RepID=UPI001BAA9FA3|nr:hypothetical protein [Prevotella nigrescens]QUB50826.1 hypothetical protein J5A59_02665 [Prevotella nigrescens]
MRKSLSILFILLYNVTALAQLNNITGKYYNIDGSEIEIKENMFYYILHQGHNAVWSDDTLARCKIQKVNTDFLKISSDPLETVIRKSIYVCQFSEETLSDSINVIFQIPCKKQNLKIEIYDNNLRVYKISYSKDNTSLKLPINTISFSFIITPEYIIPHSIDGCFYGIVSFDSQQEYTIKKGNNFVIIKIPMIDDTFFERYYIVDDYLQVTRKNIYWKGKTYLKKD